MNMRPIAISLSPNTQIDDVFLSLKSLFAVNSWQKGKSIPQLSAWFQQKYNINKAYLFNSGRSALYCILKSLKIGRGDEVIVQGFTCIAVPDPIIWCKAIPVYVDIDDSLNLDPELLEQSITKKTKAIIVQHTFGIPADIIKIKKIAQKYNLVLIEDCAHALGAVHNGIALGKFGDIAFFSFGRDKIVSSVFGGAAFFNLRGNRKPQLIKARDSFDKIYEDLPQVSYFWIFQQLLHPLLFFIIMPLYNWYLGKIILWLVLKLNLLSKPIYKSELNSEKPEIFPALLPNALACLALNQLQKLDKFNSIRKNIAAVYYSKLTKYKRISLPVRKVGSVYLRFNILLKDRDKLFVYFKKHKILLGTWYSAVIDPKGADLEKVYYRKGTLPESEKKAILSINLPTYPTLSDKEVVTILNLLEKYENKSDN